MRFWKFTCYCRKTFREIILWDIIPCRPSGITVRMKVKGTGSNMSRCSRTSGPHGPEHHSSSLNRAFVCGAAEHPGIRCVHELFGTLIKPTGAGGKLRLLVPSLVPCGSFGGISWRLTRLLCAMTPGCCRSLTDPLFSFGGVDAVTPPSLFLSETFKSL